MALKKYTKTCQTNKFTESCRPKPQLKLTTLTLCSVRSSLSMTPAKSTLLATIWAMKIGTRACIKCCSRISTSPKDKCSNFILYPHLSLQNIILIPETKPLGSCSKSHPHSLKLSLLSMSNFGAISGKMTLKSKEILKIKELSGPWFTISTVSSMSSKATVSVPWV